jgi:hypothetical protein
VNHWAWGLILDSVTFVGVFLLAHKHRIGWIMSVFAQLVWMTYAISTQQWGFIPGILAYTTVSIHGYVYWTDHSEQP